MFTSPEPLIAIQAKFERLWRVRFQINNKQVRKLTSEEIKMNVNPKNNHGLVTISEEKYRQLLEDHVEQSIQIKQLQNSLQLEYNFAEEKLAEIAKLNESLERVTHFLESKGLVEEYTEYNKMLDSAPVEATENES